jgi:pyruvate dehydrogenase E2 component (dihydrolipoamide acetyltransferase)
MEFKLPDIGEGVTEGEIVNWLVVEGQSVVAEQPMVEVMTDKATVTIDAPAAGAVSSIKAQAGQTVPVGAVLAIIESSGASPARPASAPTSAPAAAPAPKPAAAPAPAAAPVPAASGGRFEFKLPEVGEGVTEGEVVSWHAQAGGQVKEGQPLVEIMTDKATVTIDAPVSGTLESISGKEGQTVAVGKVLAVIVTAGGTAAPVSAPTTAPATAQSSTPVSRPAAPVAPVAERDRVLATPVTRKRARELGVNIGTVAGTGQHGRITLEDVEHAASQPVAPVAAPASAPATVVAVPKAPSGPAAPIAASAGDRREPIRGVRRKIYEAMQRSKNTAAHFSYVEEINVTALVALRNELKPVAEKLGAKLTFLPFIVKATVAALKDFPNFNANVDDEAGELILKGDYNVGIAADTDYGLVVPVLKQADKRSLLDVAAEIQRLGKGARDRKLAPDDMKGGSFTITSAGHLGGLFATPIINYPEVAIMGVHKIAKRPIVNAAGEIVVADMMWLSLSLDHRIIDGADAARFMNRVVELLEEPRSLLLI